MRVYFIYGRWDGCGYVRCLLPLIHNGWDGDRIGLRKEVKPLDEAVKAALNADVVVFQRPDQVEKHKAAKLLKDAGKKIVFENDDTFKIEADHAWSRPYQELFEKKKTMMNNLLNNFAYNADLVTTSTRFLQKEYLELNKKTVVLPNCVDPDDWSEPLKNETKKVRVGLVGSTSFYGDARQIQKLFSELSKRDDVQLVLFGLYPKESAEHSAVRRLYQKDIAFWNQFKIEQQPFVQMEDYFDTLNELRLDMILIPREDNYFNRCKSNVKFLEAAMLEIPVIAQGFTTDDSPYQGDIDGYNGRIAITEDDWVLETNRMIEDENYRRALGQRARKYVLQNYHIGRHAHKWEEAYASLFNNNSHV